jgi:hypothetical protein
VLPPGFVMKVNELIQARCLVGAASCTQPQHGDTKELATATVLTPGFCLHPKLQAATAAL